MSSYAEALLEFYSGEVLGEAVYSALLGFARNDDERLKWATLLQLETETKAWLRAPMVAHGVSIEEQPSDRVKGLETAQQVKPLSWPDLMQALYDVITNDFIPLAIKRTLRRRERAGKRRRKRYACIWSSTRRLKSSSRGANSPGPAWITRLSRWRNF